MTSPADVLKDFAAAFEGGEAPIADTYLVRVSGPDRLVLEELIDRYLAFDAPPRAYDPDAFASARDSDLMQRVSAIAAGPTATWQEILPRARQRRGLRRSELAHQLAEALGLGGHDDLVEAAYHEMESGQLDNRTVSSTVLDTLAKLLKTPVEKLRDAGSAGGRATGAPAYARTFPAPGASPRRDKPSMEDEEQAAAMARVDALFRVPPT